MRYFQAHQAHKASQELQVSLEALDFPVRLDSAVPMDYPVHKGLQDSPVALEGPDRSEIPALLDPLERLASLEDLEAFLVVGPD